MEIDPKVIAEIIGEGMYTSLRKFCESPKNYAVYQAISAMPNNEWNVVCEIVAKEVIKVIGAHEVDNSFMNQMKKLNCSIDHLAEVIEITFGRKNKSISEVQDEEGLNNEDACKRLDLSSGQFPHFEQYRKT
jgi:hypothetical protein